MRTLARLFLAVALVALGFSFFGSQPANSTSMVSAPRLSGAAVLNGTLKVSNGSWIQPGSFSYQWYSCSSKISQSATVKPANCSAISGAKGKTLKIREPLVGKFILASVKSGGTQVFSASSSTSVQASPNVVSAATLAVVAAPTIGSSIDVSLGTYSGNPRPTVAFVAWYACESKHNFGLILPADCKLKSTMKRQNLGRADLGKYLLAKVTASNSMGVKSYFTSTTNQVTSAPFALSALTVNDDSPEIGQTLSGSTKVWVSYPSATLSSQWYRCEAAVSAGSSAGIGCQPIAGATNANYTVEVDDLGKHLVFSTEASNAFGAISSFSASTALIESPPVQTGEATLSGFADVDDVLTASAGSWYGYPQVNASYEWFICEASQAGQSSSLPEGCIQLPEQNSTTLDITNDMLGYYLVAGVTVANANGTVTVYTASSGAVKIAPKNVVAPFISGTARVGDELVASSGTWQAEPAPVFEYQWWLCDSAIDSVIFLKPNDCAAIDSATDSTFMPQQVHTGKFIALSVNAVNELGEKLVFATSVAAVRSVPVLLASADFTVDSSGIKPSATLIASTGSWSAYPQATFSYSWYECESVDSCILLAETGEQLNANALANGNFVKFEVTASNAEGSTSTWSATNVNVQEVPSLDVAGSLSGNAFAEQSITYSASTFAGYDSPTVTHKWFSCDSKPAIDEAVNFADCDLQAEGGTELLLTRAMQDKYIAVLEEASNSVGDTHAWLSMVETVATLPLLEVEPVISEVARVGNTLTATSGTWVSSPAATFSYEWFSCSSAQLASSVLQAGCESLAVSEDAIVLTNANNGKFISVRVSASNLVGSVSRWSATTAEVVEAPTNTIAAVVSGTPLVGDSLSVSTGSWSGYPAPSLSYKWYSCSSQVFASALTPSAGCSVVAGETQSTISLVSTYASKYLLAAVRATNSAGFAEIFTASSAVVLQAPGIISAPIVSGTASSGSTLSVSNGSWSGSPTLTFDYLWYSCTVVTAASASASANCTSTAVTSANYSLTSANAGKYLLARVTATNSAGSAVYFSASSTVVTDAPSNSVAPSISGSAFVGQVLTANVGTWSGFPTPSVSYAWYACTATHASSALAKPVDCTVIAGQSLATFTITSTQLNRFIVVAVTQNNSVGTPLTVWSASTAAVVVRVTNTAAASYTSSNLNGELLPGDTLTGSVGTWTGSPSYTYSWLRCDNPQVTSASALPAGCSVIADETTTTYVVTDEDVAKYLLFSVLASNSGSSAQSYSDGSAQVFQDISILVEPTSSSVAAGTTALVTSGTWEGFPAATVDATYEICGVIHTNLFIVNGYETCQPVNSNGSSVDIPEDATGKYLRLTLFASNERQDLVNTYSFGKITGAPAFAYLPVIAGRPQIGQVSTLESVNVWSFPNSATLTYAWFSCAQQYSSVAQVQANCSAVTQAAETTTHTTLASEAGRYQVAVVTAQSDQSTSSLSTWSLISAATAADVATAVAPHTVSSPLNCDGANAFNCALNLGNSAYTKLVFGSGTIGAVANLTGTVVFDQTRDQLTFTVTNSTASAQRVDLNKLITNSDGCLGTVQKTSWWLAAGQTKSITTQEATLGSFDLTQDCNFGLSLNSMLIAYLTIGNNGSTTDLAASGLDWVEGYFSGACLMNVKTQRYTICQNDTTLDMDNANVIAVSSTIIWDSSANTLTYTITNNTASTVYVRMRQSTTGLCRPTLPASVLTSEISVAAGATSPANPRKPNVVSLTTTYTQFEFETDAFFNGARSDCSITNPSVTGQYQSLVAAVSVSSVPGY